ncbi:hypothetical protein HDU67_002542, partial [Dinochytrium kinnereticum]
MLPPSIPAPPLIAVVEPAAADDGVAIPPQIMVRRRRSSGDASAGPKDDSDPTSPSSPNQPDSPTSCASPTNVERRSLLRIVTNGPVDSDEELDSADEEDEDLGSSDDSSETLSPERQQPHPQPHQPHRRRAHFDPIQLAFLTTCKLNQERVTPMNDMKRIILMQNLLHAIYGSWAELLPQAAGGNPGGSAAYSTSEEDEEEELSSDDEEDEEEDEQQDDIPHRHFGRQSRDLSRGQGAEDGEDSGSDTTEDGGETGDGEMLDVAPKESSRKPDLRLNLSQDPANTPDSSRRVVDKFLSAVDGSVSPTAATASTPFFETATPSVSVTSATVIRPSLEGGVSMQRSRSSDDGSSRARHARSTSSKIRLSLPSSQKDDDDDDVPLGQIAARHSTDSKRSFVDSSAGQGMPRASVEVLVAAPVVLDVPAPRLATAQRVPAIKPAARAAVEEKGKQMQRRPLIRSATAIKSEESTS